MDQIAEGAVVELCPAPDGSEDYSALHRANRGDIDVDGVTIRSSCPGSSRAHRVVTGPDGAFTIEGVVPGDYEFAVQIGEILYPGITPQKCQARAQIGSQFVCRIAQPCCEQSSLELGEIYLAP